MLLTPNKYIGYQVPDFQTAWSKYYNETINPIPPHVAHALHTSPMPSTQFLSIQEVRTLTQDGYLPVETGYCIAPDSALHVAVLTHMPQVSPAMWHWWFGWHGSMDNRYKLWHPKAHQSAQWKDGDNTRTDYINRTSMIEEYIGKKLEKASIQFCDPSVLNLPSQTNKNDMLFICARVGYTHIPLNFGWLVHQVRTTPQGAEMRSRFWMGGSHIQIRGNGGVLSNLVSAALQRFKKLPKEQAIDLLTHCAEEMNHLAGILPALYHEFGTTK